MTKARSKSGIKGYFGPPENVKVDDGLTRFAFNFSHSFLSEKSNLFHYSRDGSLIAILDPNEGINIYETVSEKLVSKINLPKANALYISEGNTYLLTWHRFQQGEEGVPSKFL